MVECSHFPKPPTCPSSITTITTDTTNKTARIEVVPIWNVYQHYSNRLWLILMIGILLLIGGFINFISIHSYQSTYQLVQRLNYDSINDTVHINRISDEEVKAGKEIVESHPDCIVNDSTMRSSSPSSSSLIRTTTTMNYSSSSIHPCSVQNNSSIWLPSLQLSPRSKSDDNTTRNPYSSQAAELSSSFPNSISALQSSPAACKPFSMTENRKITRLYVYHMRKAGGTTIAYYFKRLAQAYNLKLKIEEGGIAEDPLVRRNDTFYITHMRDPAERTISHYKYSFRWNCQDLIHNQSFIPTTENSKSLYEFLIKDSHAKLSLCKQGRRMWTCSANCYSRWFALPNASCDPRPLKANTTYSSKLYNIAYEKMKNYDLIIDSNRLFTDPEYVGRITKFFGINGLLGSYRSPFCDKESKQANQQSPLVLDEQELHHIRYRNAVDYQLYQDFILSCRNTNIEFPSMLFQHYISPSFEKEQIARARRNRRNRPTTTNATKTTITRRGRQTPPTTNATGKQNRRHRVRKNGSPQGNATRARKTTTR